MTTTYKPQVLVIDDQPGIRKLLTDVLESAGYGVLIAVNGCEGIQIAYENDPDVILLDMRMPGMLGIDVLREIENQRKKGNIIVMTAYCEIESVNEIRAAGAREYLTKPFDIGLICRLIQEIIDEQLEECKEVECKESDEQEEREECELEELGKSVLMV